MALIVLRLQHCGGTVPLLPGVTIEDGIGDAVEPLALGIEVEGKGTFASVEGVSVRQGSLSQHGLQLRLAPSPNEQKESCGRGGNLYHSLGA